jgi:hypothetical protein
MLPGLAGISAGITERPPLSFVSIGTASATSVTLPSHQSGDLILVLAQNEGSTVPSLPSGFSDITSGTSSLDDDWAWRVGYKFATSAGDTSGTWDNSTRIAAAIYRGVTAIGNTAETIAGTTTPTWGNMALTGLSLVVGLLAHEDSKSATGVPFTTRDNSNYRTWWDTNAPVSSFTSVSANLANGGRGTTTITIELVRQ